MVQQPVKAEQKKQLVPGRYVMVGGTFLLAMLVLVDRACISVAKDPISQSLGLDDRQMGWVLSIFALGYAIFQTPSGLLADRYGPRLVLTAVVSIWSFFTALTGAAVNFVSLLVVRFLFGLGEAGAFPGISKAVYLWIPVRERGVVNGINFSGGRLGAAFSLPLIALLIDTYGWREAFLILGLIGVGWAVAWYVFFRDNPLDHPHMSAAECQLIEAGRQHPAAATQQLQEEEVKVPLSVIFRSRNMWLAMGQYFASNFTFFFCLTWLFPHLKERFALESVEAGFYSALPLVAGAAGNVFAGWLVDLLYRRGHWRWSRSLPAIIGFALAAAGLVGSLYMGNVMAAVICLAVAVFGADMTLSPSWTFCADIGKKYSGAVSGTMNMAGNLGSFITALAFPYLKVWTGSETPFFYIGALLNVLAIVIWLYMKPENGLLAIGKRRHGL
jgi:MFS transporter, ACS family, glucarate transporter